VARAVRAREGRRCPLERPRGSQADCRRRGANWLVAYTANMIAAHKSSTITIKSYPILRIRRPVITVNPIAPRTDIGARFSDGIVCTRLTMVPIRSHRVKNASESLCHATNNPGMLRWRHEVMRSVGMTMQRLDKCFRRAAPLQSGRTLCHRRNRAYGALCSGSRVLAHQAVGRTAGGVQGCSGPCHQ